MTVDLYGLLGVTPDADADEIRTAWRAAIKDLDPSDRLFRAYNQAAETLLDPDRRAAYDAELAAELATEAAPEPEPQGTPAPLPPPPPAAQTPVAVEEVEPEPTAPEPAGGWTPPVWLLALVAALALSLVVATAWTKFHDPPDGDVPSAGSVATAQGDAQAAAEKATAVIFGYDYQHLQASHDAAAALLTGSYKDQYERLWTSAIVDNARTNKTKVTVQFEDAGLVRSGQGQQALTRADVLVFFTQLTTDKVHSQPVASYVFATLSMVKQGGTWLVSKVTGPPAA